MNGRRVGPRHRHRLLVAAAAVAIASPAFGTDTAWQPKQIVLAGQYRVWTWQVSSDQGPMSNWTTAQYPDDANGDSWNVSIGSDNEVFLGATVTVDDLTNDGHLIVSSWWPTDQLNFALPDSLLTGTGLLTLGSTAPGFGGGQVGSATGARLTQDVNHTIDGFGAIAASLQNRGTVNANVAGKSLGLAGPGMTNTGILKATNGATLSVGATVEQSGGGEIRADGGTVNIGSGANVNGHLSAINGGTFLAGHTSNLASDPVLHDLTNDATVQIVGTTYLGGTFEGTGRMAMVSPYGDIRATGQPVTNGPGHTIEGAGALTGLTLDNRGTIDANVSGRSLGLSGGSYTNTGVLKASGGGTLFVWAPVAQSGSGRILADGGTVNIGGGADVNGQLTATNGGTIQVGLASKATAPVLHDLVNDAAVQVVSTTSLGGTVGGTGRLTLVGPSGGIYATAQPVTHSAGHTIDGAGGLNGLTLDNQGTIDANVNGKALVLSGGSYANSGIMRSTGGGTLNVAAPVAQSPAGRILADGGTVTLPRAQISGGALTAAAGSAINGSGSSLIDVAVRVDGTFTLNGTSLSGGSLSGTGTVVGNVAGYAGLLAPGDSPGILTIQGNLGLTAGAGYEWQVSDTAADLLSVTGNLTFGPTLTLHLQPYELTSTRTGDFPLFQVSGSIGTLPALTLDLPQGWTSDGLVVSGNQIVLANLSATPVPEPASLLVLAPAAALVTAGRRRRRVGITGA